MLTYTEEDVDGRVSIPVGPYLVSLGWHYPAPPLQPVREWPQGLAAAAKDRRSITQTRTQLGPNKYIYDHPYQYICL